MHEDFTTPQPGSSGNSQPPRPPNRTTAGLNPDDDEPDRNRRATIAKTADGEGRFIRHSGGLDHYAHVSVRVEPNPLGKGIEIRSDALEGTMLRSHDQPMTDAVREALDYGVVVKCPLTDILVHIIGGSSKPDSSTDLAFKMAAIFAIKEAVRKAEPILIG
jgi:elongation factor G